MTADSGSGQDIGDADRVHVTVGLDDRERSVDSEVQSPVAVVHEVMPAEQLAFSNAPAQPT